ncbi:MAG: HNH endonuclease, partial [Ignavibacteriales bacterium]|nr:HNH endonuclease [Ignavibacteriales bacterium]
DTYRGSTNDPLSLNLYTYCSNNPIMYFDPTGHNKESLMDRFINWLTGNGDDKENVEGQRKNIGGKLGDGATDEEMARWDSVIQNADEKPNLDKAYAKAVTKNTEQKRNELVQLGKEGASIAVGFTPADIAKDAADFKAGKDTFTGEPMNRWALAAMILLPQAGDQAVRQFAKNGTNAIEESVETGIKKEVKAPTPRKPKKGVIRIVENEDGTLIYTKKTKTGREVDVTYKNEYPDFAPYKYKGTDGKAEVPIKYTGDRKKDFDAANKAAGFDNTPAGYTWHHVEDAETMILVESDVHEAFTHTGGFSIDKFLRKLGLR